VRYVFNKCIYTTSNTGNCFAVKS